MKVLHVIPYMHPSAGGPPVVVEQLVRQERSRGVDSKILTSALLSPGGVQELRVRFGNEPEVNVLPTRKGLWLWGPDARRRTFDLVARSDIVVVHTLWHALGVWARRACQKHGKPWLMMPHGMLDPYSLGVKRGKKNLYLRLFEQANLLGAQRMLYTTEEEKMLVEVSVKEMPPSVLVPLGADLPEGLNMERAKGRFHHSFPSAKGRKCLLFLSRIHPKKGLDRLFPALARIKGIFPDLLLIIAGSGEPSYLAELEKQIRELALENNVLFTGMLQDELKWGAFAASGIFVLPSRQENFAIVVAEAMHMGLPVVLTDKVNSWPYVKKAEAGFVVQDGNLEEGFIHALTSLLSDPIKARDIGKRGSALAREELTWEHAADAICACYREIGSAAQSIKCFQSREPII